MLVQFHDLLAAAAARRGEAPALAARGGTVAYAPLWRDAAAVGGGLRELGLRRGDRVAVYLDKRIETVVALFATSVAGGAFVPVNPLLRPPQVAHILRDSGARVLVTSADRLALLRPVLPPSVEHAVVVGERGADDDLPAPPHVHRWDALADVAPATPRAGVDVDMAAILYTSGSTGKPKGVVLSHRNLLVGAASVEGDRDDADDREHESEDREEDAELHRSGPSPTG